MSLPDGYRLSDIDIVRMRTAMSMSTRVEVTDPGDVLDRWRAELQLTIGHDSLVDAGIDPGTVSVDPDVHGEFQFVLARASLYVCDTEHARREGVHLFDAGDSLGDDEAMFTGAIQDGVFEGCFEMFPSEYVCLDQVHTIVSGHGFGRLVAAEALARLASTDTTAVVLFPSVPGMDHESEEYRPAVDRLRRVWSDIGFAAGPDPWMIRDGTWQSSVDARYAQKERTLATFNR